MPEVSKTRELADTFIVGLSKEFGEIRHGIHVSDVLYCLRLAYFEKTNPKPIDEVDLNFFVDGDNRHRSLQRISGLKKEVTLEKYGVVGHLDLFKNGEPIEIKTTRAAKGVSNHYVRQLGYYCVLANTNKGHLIIQRILNKDEPWEWYAVNYNKEEIERLDSELKHDAELLQEALETQNIQGLPRTRYPWKCRYCKYYYECREPSDEEKSLIEERLNRFIEETKR